MGCAYVADTNSLGLAALNERLHLLPPLAVVPPVDHIARPIRELREAVIITYDSLAPQSAPVEENSPSGFRSSGQ